MIQEQTLLLNQPIMWLWLADEFRGRILTVQSGYLKNLLIDFTMCADGMAFIIDQRQARVEVQILLILLRCPIGKEINLFSAGLIKTLAGIQKAVKGSEILRTAPDGAENLLRCQNDGDLIFDRNDAPPVLIYASVQNGGVVVREGEFGIGMEIGIEIRKDPGRDGLEDIGKGVEIRVDKIGPSAGRDLCPEFCCEFVFPEYPVIQGYVGILFAEQLRGFLQFLVVIRIRLDH